MTLTTESAYLPSTPAKLPNGPWLILAPHPDDETFGMGGTILLAKEAGIEVDVIFLTDGSAANVAIENLLSIRENEAKKVAKLLGIRELFFWRETDRELNPSPHLIKQLSDQILHCNYASVFFPSPQEPHPDHRITSVIAWESLRLCNFIAEPFSYEISVQGHTNQLLDISQVVSEKRKLMALYESQLSDNHYIDRILGLNQARSWSLPLSVSHAEAYYHWPKEDRSLNAILLSIATQLSSEQSLPSNSPLISVITRTQNRPEFLRQAIRSVAAQTYPNIELVVINDGGVNCTDLVREEAIGNIKQYHYEHLEIQSGRSYAANFGLENSHGDFIIFLDDDDWFESDHLSKLTAYIIKHPETKLVYTEVKCVDGNNILLKNQFSTKFNATHLIAGNYIPIHSALFSRSIVNHGCRFDESFDFYEDWDFWIQASMLTDFLFVKGFSAIYRICNQTGFGVNAPVNTRIQASLALFNKWLPQLNEMQLISLMESVRFNFLKQEQLDDKNRQLEQINLQLIEKDQQFSEQNQQLIERNQQLSRLNQQLVEKDQQFSELNQLLAGKNHLLTEQNQQLVEKEKQFIEFNQIISIKDQFITEQNQQLKEHQKLIKQLEQISAEKNQQIQTHLNLINEIYSSKSWRITVPLRQISVFRKFLSSQTFGRLKSTATLPATESTELSPYQKWIDLYDTLNDVERKKIRIRIEEMPYKPEFSIILPVIDVPLDCLKKTIQSVQQQLYKNWELCIFVNTSKNKKIAKYLKQLSIKNSQIHIILNKEHEAIYHSSLDQVSSEFITFIYPNDKLSEHALFWFAETINNKPEASLIYSDEDKLSESSRIDPDFKPNWNPELFLSYNYISNLTVFRKDILNKIENFSINIESAQKYDLTIRYIEKISTQQICHIPRILYHSGTITNKEHASLACKKVMNSHLLRCNIKAHVEANNQGLRIHYDLPEKPALVSIIIPTRNGLNYLRTCIESIYSLTNHPNYEIILIDNGSDDKACLAYLSQLKTNHSNFKVIRDDQAFNYSRLNNLAVQSAQGELIALLNNDIEVISPDWLDEMASIALQENSGAVGAKLLYPDNTLQHAGIILGIGGWAGHAHKRFPASASGYKNRAKLRQNVSAVTGACLVISRSKFLQVGGLNEVDLKIACNDVDLCLKLLKKGYRNVWTPYAELYHHESATRGYEDSPEKKARFANELAYMKHQWGEILENDPAYNPNLAIDREDFSLAFPPRVEVL